MTPKVPANDDQLVAALGRLGKQSRLLLSQFPQLGQSPRPWLQALEHLVLPLLEYPDPLLVMAICGSGSSGKSTLFNMLAGGSYSATGFRSGMTQRLLLSVTKGTLRQANILAYFQSRLEVELMAYSTKDDVMSPGAGLYLENDQQAFPGVLIDTPDFDTGEGDDLPNRRRALRAIDAAELLVYVFTNATYNNSSNLAFMRSILGEVGGREVILVYRVSRVLSDLEAEQHFKTVAHDLYRDIAHSTAHMLPQQVIGCYRIDESDDVALGRAQPVLREVLGSPPFHQLISTIDVMQLHRRVLHRELAQIAAGAALLQQEASTELARGQTYQAVVSFLMARGMLRALKSFPAEQATRFFLQAWEDTSPTAVRMFRSTSKAIGLPLSLTLGLVRRARDSRKSSEATQNVSQVSSPEAVFLREFIAAAEGLRATILEAEEVLSVTSESALEYRQLKLIADTYADYIHTEAPIGQDSRKKQAAISISCQVPPSLRDSLEAIRQQPWRTTLDHLVAQTQVWSSLDPEHAENLRSEVRNFRSQLGISSRLREVFFSSLSLLPPVLGIAYVVSTGDILSGGGVSVHLHTLFGANDLLAIVALPMTTGLNEVDKKQMERLLSPVIQSWFLQRNKHISLFFEDELLSPLLAGLDRITSCQMVADSIRDDVQMVEGLRHEA